MDMTVTPDGDGPIRVFLLDDHEVVRRGLKDLLEADGDIVVVGESGLAQEAIRRIASWASPDSPTTTMSPSASSRSLRPRRTTSWSSRRNTRMGPSSGVTVISIGVPHVA